MSAPQSLTIPLAAELAARLAAAAERSGLTAAELAARAIADHLDGVTAYGRLGEEMALVKDRLAELAPSAIAEICRYRTAKAPAA
jgi:predicted transcriptional regulator